MDLSIYLRYYSAAGIYFSFRWGPFVHSLEIVQWDSTRRDHPGNLGGVSGSGPVNRGLLNWALVFHALDFSLLEGAFLRLGHQACNSWV